MGHSSKTITHMVHLLLKQDRAKILAVKVKPAPFDQSQVCLEKDWRVWMIFPIEVKGKQVGRYFNG